MKYPTVEKFDLIIVGSGLAGLYSALYASRFCKTALLTKSDFDMSNSYWAQGGIAAAIGEDDSPALHLDDTITAGRGLCNRRAVETLVTEGRERIFDLISMGMKFDTEKGKIALGLEGGHSKRRVLHAGGDSTGREVVTFLTGKVKESHNITIFENQLAYKLASDGNAASGLYSYNIKTGQNTFFSTKAVILASGGASGIFSRTTNPLTSTGDGAFLAWEAGAEIMDMEFIQFHPTSFYSESGRTFLVSEAVRGEGGKLVNASGERFMLKYHELAELAPRDVVSKAIYEELKKSGEKCIYLKLDHLDPVKMKKRFSNIFREAAMFGVDITKDPVPVAPAAHYTIGGLRTGLYGETNVKGLYACGETADTGVNGANRLASNSLLECLVFGKRCVDSALSIDSPSKITDPEVQLFRTDDSKAEKFLEIKNGMARLMTSHCGIVREETSLNEALNKIEEITAEFEEESEYYDSRIKSLATVGKLMLTSALLRKESRGGHIRLDYPEENGGFLHHVVLQKGREPKYLSTQ